MFSVFKLTCKWLFNAASTIFTACFCCSELIILVEMKKSNNAIEAIMIVLYIDLSVVQVESLTDKISNALSYFNDICDPFNFSGNEALPNNARTRVVLVCANKELF